MALEVNQSSEYMYMTTVTVPSNQAALRPCVYVYIDYTSVASWSLLCDMSMS